MVISRSPLPKALNIIGIVLWLLVARNYRMKEGFWLHQTLEHFAIIGGLLYLTAVETIGVPHPLITTRSPPQPK